MKKIILFAALFLGCTQPQEDIERLLSKQGYTDVKTCGYVWFSCGQGDQYHTCFEAKLNGVIIKGVVCKGLFFKSSTIRFED